MAAGPPEEALVRLRVQPRAARDEIVSWQDDALRVRVSAPPVEGEANVAIRKLLAGALGVAPSTVEVVRGERSRDKVVRVAGLSLAQVRARLAAVVAVVAVLSVAAPAAADHLRLDPGARPLAPRPFDADVSVRTEDGGFSIGGRLSGFGQTLGAWLRGRVHEGGLTLDGRLDGERAWNFRLDADPRGPSLRLDVTPAPRVREIRLDPAAVAPPPALPQS
ncbi:MAG TPA: DUF167 domain-containing protein [Terriglobales bacterium]|nr:DUF167 domain-containing protein [Terriglobales bacterium]